MSDRGAAIRQAKRTLRFVRCWLVQEQKGAYEGWLTNIRQGVEPHNQEWIEKAISRPSRKDSQLAE